MAGVMFANAMPKDAHLRDRAHRSEDKDGPLQGFPQGPSGTVTALHRRHARDLLQVLFVHGPALEEECLEEPYAQAIGVGLAGVGDAGTVVAQVVDTIFIHNTRAPTRHSR
jgi:hypothetical protein